MNDFIWHDLAAQAEQSLAMLQRQHAFWAGKNAARAQQATARAAQLARFFKAVIAARDMIRSDGPWGAVKARLAPWRVRWACWRFRAYLHAGGIDQEKLVAY